MKNNLKIIVVILSLIIGAVIAYRSLAIRVVNYEIAGIQIPSRYNIITGKVAPIVDYQGKAIRATVKSHKLNDLGLSDEQVALAQLKWALFEQWANARSEYNGWDNDPEVFKKAHDEFRKQLTPRRTPV